MTPATPDQYGHADAWLSPPAPGDVDDVDAWAERNRYRWAATLLIEGDSRREDRIDAGAEILERLAERHPGAYAALAVRADGPGPGPRSICLTPVQRQLLRGALVVFGNQ